MGKFKEHLDVDLSQILALIDLVRNTQYEQAVPKRYEDLRV